MVQVWVANHTSIIDYAVLSAAAPFACIMQLQPGFLGFLQTRVLPCVGGLFFNRTEARAPPLLWTLTHLHVLVMRDVVLHTCVSRQSHSPMKRSMEGEGDLSLHFMQADRTSVWCVGVRDVVSTKAVEDGCGTRCPACHACIRQPAAAQCARFPVHACAGEQPAFLCTRAQVNDRRLVHERMVAHVRRADATPLLVFPEGTCVNNEYCVMFKRGAFDLGATVCPIAIKYNPFFVEAFWNSKRQSLRQHIVRRRRAPLPEPWDTHACMPMPAQGGFCPAVY